MKSWKLSFVLLIVAVAVAGFISGGEPPAPPEEPEENLQDPPPPPECQKNWDFTLYDEVRSLVSWERGGRDPKAFLSGPGETQNTPEFHDCQRFVMEPTYSEEMNFSDGIFTIFAVPKADPRDPHVPDSVYSEAKERDLALPAAQIFAETAYEPLKIEPGFSCLYLYPTGGGGFAAHLRYDEGDEERCSEPIPISEIGSPDEIWETLYVDRSRSEGADPMGYPVVARWIWHFNEETRLQEYHMGVWCDQGWCEVRADSTRTATPSFAKGKGVPPDVANLRQFRVNGWFDEQILAGYNGSLYVSGIVGTVIPAPRLGEYGEDMYRNGRWVQTARVALTPLPHLNPENPFEEKLNLGMSRSHQAGLNQVWLCRGPWESTDETRGCQQDGAEEPDPLRADQIHFDDDQWWGKIVRRGGGPPVTKYFSVARCGYDFQVAGTARWRWLEDDPGIWMRCINGCCELDGKT